MSRKRDAMGGLLESSIENYVDDNLERCTDCSKVIIVQDDIYTEDGSDLVCEQCTNQKEDSDE